jgi:serine/threonine-protein kinase
VAKLLDRAGPATHPLGWVGTPEYMAPEQTAGGGARDAGPAIDVYALGVILYEMLTGRPPFRAEEPLETLRQVREEEPMPPHRLRPRLARDLEAVCLKCLHKDPRRRYGSAGELAEDLERWLRGEPTRARPAGPLGRCAKWARRHPERAALAAVAAALVLALAGGWFWQLWSANAEDARQLADAADSQLLLVRYAVDQTARGAEIRDQLRRPTPGRELRAFLERTRQEFVRWFTRPGESPPIINWFVMDPAGVILADSYDEPRSVGHNYAFRDYYAGLMQPGREAEGSVYLSRVYESEQDGRYKFTAVTRVVDGGRVLGLLGASIACDARLAGLDMRREPPGARVVAPMDAGRKPGAPATRLPPYVVFLHGAYARAGQRPDPVSPAQAAVLRDFERDPARRTAVDAFSGGSFVHYARVGESHFVALVEQPYPWPVPLVQRRPRACLAVVALLGGAVVVLPRVYRSRRRPSVAATAEG